MKFSSAATHPRVTSNNLWRRQVNDVKSPKMKPNLPKVPLRGINDPIVLENAFGNQLRPLSGEEILEVTKVVKEALSVQGIEFDVDHDIFDPYYLVYPAKADRDANKLTKRIIAAPFWRGGQYDVYTVYNVEIEIVNNLPVGKIVSSQIIKNGRPKYSCIDDIMVNKVLFDDKELIAMIIERMNAGQQRITITEDNVRNYLYFDVAIDGRLDDCCKCIDCQGPFRIIKDTHPRPHSFIATPFFNDSLYYCNNGAVPPNTDCGPCECIICDELTSCPTNSNGDTLFPGSVSAYIQPIEGIFVIFDRRSNEILSVVITEEPGAVPIQTGNLDWRRTPRETLKPLVSGMPEGPSWVYDDVTGIFTWEKFEFRIGVDGNLGPVLWEVYYLDDANGTNSVKRRKIADSISLQEHITRYGNPRIPSRARTFFDIGEYPPRDLLTPIQAGLDGFPPYTTLIDVPYSTADGGVFPLEKSIGLFEYENPQGGWSHLDYSCDYTSRLQGRANRVLGIGWRHQIANYVYINVINFDQIARIYCDISATGVMEHTGIDLESADHDERLFGTITRPYTLADNHLHLAVWRIDFDIDGANHNTIEEKEITFDKVSKTVNPCSNAFDETGIVLKNESEASVRTQNFKKGRTWIVKGKGDHEGDHPSYMIVPSPGLFPAISPCTRVAKRAFFTQTQVSFTKYKEGEFYDIGVHPIEQDKDTGLAVYLKDNDNLVDTDVVAHVGVTFGHKPSLEEWPVMPRKFARVELIPEGFFKENPALDVDPGKWLALNKDYVINQ